jgi:hypothetical protein
MGNIEERGLVRNAFGSVLPSTMRRIRRHRVPINIPIYSRLGAENLQV